MSTQTYVDGVTLTAAAEFNRFDTISYAVLTGVAGTNTITAGGPANYSYSATTPPVWFIPAVTNTGATTINVTPSGASALGAKNIFSGGLACAGGELVAGVPVGIVYDGTQFNIIGGGRSGVWTPVLTFATVGNLSVTYTTQTGFYRRVGNMVTVWANINTATFTHTSASGACQITGLPFAHLTSAGARTTGPLQWEGITKANYTDINAEITSAAQIVTLRASGSGQPAANIEAGDMPTAGNVELYFSVTYPVAA